MLMLSPFHPLYKGQAERPAKPDPVETSGSNHAGANGSNNNGHNRNGGSQSLGCSPLDPRGC